MKQFKLASELMTLCLLLTVCAGVARAQSGRVKAGPTPVAASAATEAAGGLAVEVVQHDGRRSWIPGNETVWFGRFGRVTGWQSPAHVPPVRAVQVASSVKSDDTVLLIVSVRLGARFHDEVRPLATFEAREGEGLIVEGLREFGVMPIELKVVRARTPAPQPPYIKFSLRSLELLAVDPVDVSFPSYNVRLRNLSGKTISAMGVDSVTEVGGLRTGWVHNPQNEPLAAGGAIYELNAFGGSQGRMLPDGYAPDALRTVTIHTVVFSDGTFEGSEGEAAWVNAMWRGRKIQLERALPIVRSALDAPEAEGAVESFRKQITALGETPAPEELAALHARFPRLNAEQKARVLFSIEHSLHKVRLDLLDALKRFEAASRDNPGRVTFRQWLEGVRGMYDQWLARL